VLQCIEGGRAVDAFGVAGDGHGDFRTGVPLGIASEPADSTEAVDVLGAQNGRLG
jgi:hypothetical protein